MTRMKQVRRAALAGAVGLAGFACALLSHATAAPAASSSSANVVLDENHLQGDDHWTVALKSALRSEHPWAPAPVDAYSGESSVAPGGTIDLHVDAEGPYRVEISRLGWYSGQGGRLVACEPSCSGSEPASPQPPVPAPAADGYLAANWPTTLSVPVESSWTTGYYVATLTLTSGQDAGYAAWVPFIVKPPSELATPILVVAPVNTWQAYNPWGGKSLYGYNSTDGVAAQRVSFDRPYHNANGLVFAWEYNLIRYLELMGANVSYATDADISEHPSELLRHRLVIVAGHDEYWSKSMRDGYDAAVRSGVNLAFMGADDADWQIRYENNDRTIDEYRTAQADPESDPSLKTVGFAQLSPPRPPCQLLGVDYGGLAAAGDAPRDYLVPAAAVGDPLMVGTGFQAGDDVAGLVGYEWDSYAPGCGVPKATSLFEWSGNSSRGPSSAAAVVWTAPSGARVFSAGTLELPWGLDGFAGSAKHTGPVEPKLQRFFVNLIHELGYGDSAPEGAVYAPSGNSTTLSGNSSTGSSSGSPSGATGGGSPSTTTSGGSETSTSASTTGTEGNGTTSTTAPPGPVATSTAPPSPSASKGTSGSPTGDPRATRVTKRLAVLSLRTSVRHDRRVITFRVVAGRGIEGVRYVLEIYRRTCEPVSATSPTGAKCRVRWTAVRRRGHELAAAQRGRARAGRNRVAVAASKLGPGSYRIVVHLVGTAARVRVSSSPADVGFHEGSG